MIDQADQPWLAGMLVLIGQTTFGSINLSFFQLCQEPLGALLGFWLTALSTKLRDACGGVQSLLCQRQSSDDSMIDDGLKPIEVTGRWVGFPESQAVSRESDSRRLLHRHDGRCSTGTIVVVFVEMRV
jgi:hypothetical protein